MKVLAALALALVSLPSFALCERILTYNVGEDYIQVRLEQVSELKEDDIVAQLLGANPMTSTCEELAKTIPKTVSLYDRQVNVIVNISSCSDGMILSTGLQSAVRALSVEGFKNLNYEVKGIEEDQRIIEIRHENRSKKYTGYVKVHTRYCHVIDQWLMTEI